MTLVRHDNKTNPNLQGSIYFDVLNKFIRIIDKVTKVKIDQRNIKVQLGGLLEFNYHVIGQSQGYRAILKTPTSV